MTTKKQRNKKLSKSKGLSDLDQEFGVEYWSRQDVDELVNELGISEKLTYSRQNDQDFNERNYSGFY